MKRVKRKRNKDGEGGRGGLLVPTTYSPLSYIRVLRNCTSMLMLSSFRLGVVSLTGSCLLTFKHYHSWHGGPDSTPGSHTRKLVRNFRMNSSRRGGLGGGGMEGVDRQSREGTATWF